MYLEVLGQDVVFVNSHDAAVDLLDKRSGIYSSRPQLTMLHELKPTRPCLMLLLIDIQAGLWLGILFVPVWRKVEEVQHRFPEVRGVLDRGPVS